MTINTKLLYDEDGFCRLCSLPGEKHTEECPGSILHGLRYEVTYSGRYCTSGCCGGDSGSASSETLMGAVAMVAPAVREFVTYSASARLVYRLNDDTKTLINQENERVAQLEREAEALEEARETLRSNTEEFSRSVQALEAEKGDLTPEAYTRRMRELREKYKALGVVFSDSVEIEAPADATARRN